MPLATLVPCNSGCLRKGCRSVNIERKRRTPSRAFILKTRPNFLPKLLSYVRSILYIVENNLRSRYQTHRAHSLIPIPFPYFTMQTHCSEPLLVRSTMVLQGLAHWAVSDDYDLLFDSVKSQLLLLNVSDTSLMDSIYQDNNSGWIKIGITRDPVTRLLSLYFSLVQNICMRFQYGGDFGGWYRTHANRSATQTYERTTKTYEWTDTTNKSHAQATAVIVSGNKTWCYDVPTFAEVVDWLAADISQAPSQFHPITSTCGIGQSPFDTLIPFESLKVMYIYIFPYWGVVAYFT